MRRRSIVRFEPRLERFEKKVLLNASLRPADVASHNDVSEAVAARAGTSLPKRFLAYRLTNPTKRKVNLFPPFQQVLVQATQPVPGQVYNVLYVAVKNGTAQTFTASNNFAVRLTNQSKAESFPVLTGSDQWRPQQWMVFYVLTKKYYPVSFVAGGFQFDLGRSSTLVPGPSGIFLRLKYNPATFARTLNWIVAYGQGAQLGTGSKLGLPDTAINDVLAAKTRRIDFGGHF